MIASRCTAAADTGVRRHRVLVHQPGQQLLVERAPVDADPHRLVVPHRELDQRRELRVALGLEADIARIDPVLCRAPRRRPDGRSAACGRYSGSRRSAARRRRAAPACRGYAAPPPPLSSRSTVMRTSSEPARQSCADLAHRRLDIGGIGIGHRLHDDGAPPPTITPPTSTPTVCLRSETVMLTSVP